MRRLSQMDLAAAANLSTRHLSFVETGRARPSDDLILRLAEALHLPLRQVNALLVTAGYAPRYTNWSLEDDETGMVQFALERLLAQHAPYPAVVTNRTYDIVMVNAGFEALITWLADGRNPLDHFTNLYRLVFAANGLRPYFVGWDVVRGVLLKRLYEESIAYQNNTLAQLYSDCVTADHPAAEEHVMLDQPLPVLTFALEKHGRELHFFTTMTTFGTAIDVTIQELKIESLFPANQQTQAFFQDRLWNA